jgi:uncharacterized protein
MIRRNCIRLISAGAMPVLAIAAIQFMICACEASSPIRDRDHTFEKSVCDWTHIKQVNVVMQKKDYSCGAAALATILRYYWGDNVPEDQIIIAIMKVLTPEEMKDRVKNGLTITDIRRASVDLGYLSTIGTLTFRQLSDSKVPLVVAIKVGKFNHFVVYRGMDYDYVYLADPIRGNIRLTYQEFICQWQKNAALVVIKPDADPPKTSPLSVHCYETRLGELNNQVIRTQPPKAFTNPLH